MRIRAVAGALVIGAAALCLAGCSMVDPIAFKVEKNTVDITFCQSFTATSMTAEFGNYDDPYVIVAVVAASGPESTFGNGKSVSAGMDTWQPASDSGGVPDDWERVDFSFYDDSGEYVGGDHLFSRDVKTSDWTWQTGYYVNKPECELDLG